jgi:hypothetical protein
VKDIDREAANRSLDSFLDAYERANVLHNTPEEHEETREAAHQAYCALRKLLGPDLIAERLGAARIARRPFEPGSAWGAEAEAAAREPVAPLSMLGKLPNSELHACGQRRMLARFLLDHEDELSPGLARNFVVSLFLLNLGEVSALMRPYSVQGLKKNSGRKTTRDFHIAARLYYLAGYRDRPIDKVLLDESDGTDNLSRDALNKFIQRQNLRDFVEAMRASGVADRLAGKPEKCELAGVYDLTQLMALTTE